jgi:hypothetical protein
MAGDLSVEACLNLARFVTYDAKNGASCNYAVDSQGRVGLGADESSRTWCTSNRPNDHRAITIEVANDGKGPEWHVSDKALAALIELCADICRRNNIKALLWKGDKNLIGQVDKQNMTVHRWFSAKDCPGNYLYGLHGYIAAEVNKRLGAAVIPAAPVTPSPPTVDIKKIFYVFFTSKGYSSVAAAGLWGNIFAESGGIPTNLQNSFQSKLGMDDAAYTAAVDNGSYTNFIHDGAGYGLAQWTYWSRKQALFEFAKATGASIGDLTMQLNFLFNELQGYTAVMNIFKAADTVREASDAVLLLYERPADQSVPVQEKRAEYGQLFYDKFAEFKPYLVRVTGNPLNIRKSAGTDSTVVGTITDGGVYTIVEEADGPGAKRWGKLKSGAGWISLGYTERV